MPLMYYKQTHHTLYISTNTQLQAISMSLPSVDVDWTEEAKENYFF